MIHPVLIYFLAAFGLTLVLTYFVRGWAADTPLVDFPDAGRHAHARPIPRAGGIALFVSVAIVLVIGFMIGDPQGDGSIGQMRKVMGLIAGTTAMFGIGLLDDWVSLRARTKFVLELIVATGIFYAGIRITGDGLGGIVLPTWAAYPITVLWIVGITNAFNLIDGSDGVAAGAALFASICMAIISAISGSELGVVVGIAVAGATLGFLFFNFPPATIFLGDSGSLFLGFTLAVLGIVTTQETTTTLAVAIPVLSLGLPILDTLLTMSRRFLRRQPIFEGDRAHIHHRLRDLGNSPRRVAFLMYGACAVFAMLSLLLVGPAQPYEAAVFVIAGGAVWMAVQRLRIPELLEMRRIVSRGIRQREVIAHNLRLRDALSRLRNAQSANDIVHALFVACEGGEFERMELVVDSDEGKALDGAPGVVHMDRGYRWSWERLDKEYSADRRWELRVPVHGPAGHRVGRLSVWCATDRDHLLTDVRLLALEFQPAIYFALVRIASMPPAPERVIEVEPTVEAADVKSIRRVVVR